MKKSPYDPQNSSSILPAEFIPPMSLDRFCEITGLFKTSAWRYEKRGWCERT
jgi:hypothetical protein